MTITLHVAINVASNLSSLQALSSKLIAPKQLSAEIVIGSLPLKSFEFILT
jgi:hypothetical protein